VTKWKAGIDAMKIVRSWANLIVKNNLVRSGFPPGVDVNLMAYFEAIARRPFDKKLAFDSMCEFFGFKE
jgi:hypothetical protein